MKLTRTTKKVITVDPGIHSAAALWVGARPKAPSHIFKFNANIKGKEALSLSNELATMVNYHKPDLVIIEQVEFWASSAKSMASASRGNLSLLAYIVGAMVSGCQGLGIETRLVSPLKWKGQLPYPALRRILKNKFGIETTSDHEASAIGIGLNHFGWF